MTPSIISSLTPLAPSAVTQTTYALLERRHVAQLEWQEPRPACGPEGNPLDAHLTLRASVHDCINLQRLAALKAGRPTLGDDANHLLDFVASHWAKVVDNSGEREDGCELKRGDGRAPSESKAELIRDALEAFHANPRATPPATEADHGK